MGFVGGWRAKRSWTLVAAVVTVLGGVVVGVAGGTAHAQAFTRLDPGQQLGELTLRFYATLGASCRF